MSVTVLLEVQSKLEKLAELKSTFKNTLPDTRAYEGCQFKLSHVILFVLHEPNQLSTALRLTKQKTKYTPQTASKRSSLPSAHFDRNV